MTVGDILMELCKIENSVNWIVALITGITIILSIWTIVGFLIWKIRKEQKFDRTIFENFGRMTCQVGDTQNNGAQNDNSPRQWNFSICRCIEWITERLKYDRQGDSKPLTGK